MENGYLKVAAVTPVVKVADPTYNRHRILALIERAATVGADIIVLPQLTITGATCQDLFYQSALLKAAEKSMEDIARDSSPCDSLIFIGFPYRYQSKLYNVAAVIYKGKVLGLVPATNIEGSGDKTDIRYFAKGPKDPVDVKFMGETIPFGTNLLFEDAASGVKVGCELGNDLFSMNPPSASHTMEGALVIVNLSADCYSVGRGSYRQTLVKAASGNFHCGYICANAGDGESTQDMVFAGERLVAENGEIISRGAPFTTGITFSHIDIELLQKERAEISSWTGNSGVDKKYRVIQYGGGLRDTIRGIGDIFKSSMEKKEHEASYMRKYSRYPFVPANKEERNSRCEEILTVQALGLKQRLDHTNITKAVIGISGGLDSTLALLVTARAFDLLNLDRNGITAVTMPGFGTTDRTHNNAISLASDLGISVREIPIGTAVRSHFKDIGYDETRQDATYENAQARERTQILMDIANMENGLVIGTGDMSELALGWATYNGDHMSMYGVNSGVPKTLIRHIIRSYADMHNGSSSDLDKHLAATLYDILDTPVSPELLPPKEGDISQKTEDIVGPYELHDFFLYYMLRYGFSPKRLYTMAVHTFEESYDEETVKSWLKVFIKRFFSQQYKRSCVPDGPKIGSVGLSPRGGFKMPSDASAALWLAELEDI